MESKLLPTPALLLSSHHTPVVYFEVTMVLARLLRMLEFLAASIVAVFLAGCSLGLGDSGKNNNNNNNNNNNSQGLSAINHIIFMAQENRSFDTYFGHLNDYRATLGLPAAVDGIPVGAANPADDGSLVTPFHLQTMCIENHSA